MGAVAGGLDVSSFDGLALFTGFAGQAQLVLLLRGDCSFCSLATSIWTPCRLAEWVSISLLRLLVQARCAER